MASYAVCGEYVARAHTKASSVSVVGNPRRTNQCQSHVECEAPRPKINGTNGQPTRSPLSCDRLASRPYAQGWPSLIEPPLPASDLPPLNH